MPALAEPKLASLRLEILIDDSRPDDREIAERVVLALDKLGIGGFITALPATTLRDRVGKGTTDLYIGQLAQPLGGFLYWWASAFAAGNDDTLTRQQGPLDLGSASREFTARLPIVPLMFRSVRIWHPTNVRGLAFDILGRPTYQDLSLFGSPVKGRP